MYENSNFLAPGPADFKLRPLIGFKDHDVNSQKARAPEFTIAQQFKMARGLKTPGPIDVGPFNRFGKYPVIGGVMYGRYKSPSKLLHWKLH